MRFKLILAAVLAWALPALASAKSVTSPNGEFVVDVGASRTVLKDRSGSELVELESDIGAPHENVHVLWAPNSRAVAIAVNHRRGSMVSIGVQINGKWVDLLDEDEAAATAEARAGGKVIAEHRKLIGWQADAIEIGGEVVTSEKPNGYRYTYIDRLIDKKVVSGQVKIGK